MLKYKIVLAGSKDVGKSSLIARFCDNVFDEHMMDTIGVAFKRKTINVEDVRIEMNIWDFGGEQKYRALFPSYVNGASASLILYDITRKETLEDIENWVNIVNTNQEGVIKILIGTKMDLEDQRQITREEAQAFSKKLGCQNQIVETSSKTGENVEDAFFTVAREIINRKLQKCNGCGEFFSRKLKHCNYCGQPILKATFS